MKALVRDTEIPKILITTLSADQAAAGRDEPFVVVQTEGKTYLLERV